MPEPLRRLPFVLLGLMTVVTFLGPFVILLVLRGGRRPVWPPDRPVEWVVFWGVSGVVAGLMVACLGVSLKFQGQFARSGEGKVGDLKSGREIHHRDKKDS
ncbi:hypothetical protein BH23PLA1_BH23PLA1_07350 [soil metagenome]